MKFVLNILKAFLINFCFIGIIFAKISCPSISPANAEDSPSHQVEAIISDVICSFRDLNSESNGTFSNTLNLTKRKIIPFIDLEYATQIALGNHWNQLDSKDRKIFERDLKNSLINDYIGNLLDINDWENINISVNNDFNQSGNITKVNMLFYIGDENSTESATITLKLIRKDRWRIFDLVYLSISILDIERVGYDSKIKRNGIEDLLQIMLERS
jgi:phospholipid transport system substrate-binding protein